MRQYIRRKSLQLLPCLDRRPRRGQSRQQRRNSNENQSGTREQNIELPQQPLPPSGPATDESNTDTPQPVQNENNPSVDLEILPEAPAATHPEQSPEGSSDGQSEVSFISSARRRLGHFVLTETPEAAADPQPRPSTQRITRSRSKTPSGDAASRSPIRKQRGRRTISPAPGPESRTKRPGEESPEEDEATCTAKLRRKGTNYQNWIDRANDADCQIPCPIQRSTLTWNDIARNPDEARRWDIGKDKKVGPNQVAMKDQVRAPALTSGENDYRKIQISRVENAGYNMHRHRMGRGVIFAEFCQRPVGSVNPHWSEIALAQYQRDYDIDTLRYVYVVDCENTETLGHMRDVLFPRLGYSKDSQEVLIWEYNTEGYKEIMGVVWGKGVGGIGT
ncbi:hypothetical protein N7522_004073 [Penicillium canescens]|nr:hypothetical protein N7522_004073 [Penicillium canescens]